MNNDNSIEPNRNRNLMLELVVFCLVLLLAAYFRFISLRANPGWYSDEGTFIEFAAHLAQGQWQIFGMQNAPMVIQRPPLFLFVLSVAFKLFGSDILVLGVLTSFYGLSCVVLIYLLGRKMLPGWLALLAAFILAIQPSIVAYNRIGLTYNQLMPLVFLTLFASWMYLETHRARWAWAACIVAALAFSTDFLGLIAPVVVAGMLILVDPRRFIPGVLLMAVIFFVLLAPFYFASPLHFNIALDNILSTRVAASPLSQVTSAVLSYGELLRRESWVLLGLIGLFLLPDKRIRVLAIVTVGLGIILIGRNQAPVGRGLHYLMGLFPLFGLGIAAFLYRACPQVQGFLQEIFSWITKRFSEIMIWKPANRAWGVLTRLVVAGLVAIILISPLAWMIFANTAQSVFGNYFIFSGNDNLDLTSEKDAVQVINYLRPLTKRNDLVLASPQIAWAVPAFGADYASIIVYQNKSGEFYIPRSMFVRPLTLEDTSYAILDPLARDFAPLVLTGMNELIRQIEQWPLAFQAGDIEVYRNPEKTSR